MKRFKLGIAIALATIGLGFSGYMGYKSVHASTTVTAGTSKITVDEAKQIALDHAGLTSEQVSFYSVEETIEEGVEMYDIEFYTTDKEYDYEIGIYNGNVLEYDYEIENADIQTNNGSTDGSVDSSTNGEVVQQPSQEAATETTNTSTSNGANTTVENTTSTISTTTNTVTSSKISVDQAKKIAVSHAGLSTSQVTFLKANVDYDNGIEIYEIEFYYNNKEYDYEISTSNGQVLEYDYDMESSYNQDSTNTGGTSNNQTGTSSNVSVSADQAKQTALSHAGLSSFQAGNIKCELDTDDGIKKYEVEFTYNNIEYSYDINASTGSIISFEQDCD